MKKFFMIAPLQPVFLDSETGEVIKDLLCSSIYQAAGNRKLMYQHKTRFPLIPVINGYALEGEEIRVIAVTPDTKSAWYHIEQLKEAGVQDADVAIVSMASHLEDSVETILNLKELGVGHIIAKANSDRIRYVLERIGADQVIQPENEMGQRVAISIMNPKISDIFQMADDYAIMEIKAPELWINHEIKQLNLRELYGVNVIGIRKNKERKVNINFKGDTVIQADDFLVIAADANKIASLNLD